VADQIAGLRITVDRNPRIFLLAAHPGEGLFSTRFRGSLP
jgi:hypothetical protein